jgi:hypothetical protein
MVPAEEDRGEAGPTKVFADIYDGEKKTNFSIIFYRNFYDDRIVYSIHRRFRIPVVCVVKTRKILIFYS